MHSFNKKTVEENVYIFTFCKLGQNFASFSYLPLTYIYLLTFCQQIVSHDTRRFRFALQSPEHVLGLPVGRCKVALLCIDIQYM